MAVNNLTLERIVEVAADPQSTPERLRAVINAVAESVKLTEYAEIVIDEIELNYHLGIVDASHSPE